MHGKGTDRHTHTHTHTQTLWLLDQLGPEGRVGENVIEQIVENPESIEQLDWHIEIKKMEDKEIEVIRTVEQRKVHSDFISKCILGSVVDKFNYEMVCCKCNKNLTKKPCFKKHMQDDHNEEIFIEL